MLTARHATTPLQWRHGARGDFGHSNAGGASFHVKR
jgi:hypothetical protein